MLDFLKADPEGWSSSGTPNCWFRRKLSPADRKVELLNDENRRLKRIIQEINERLLNIEKSPNNDRG